MKPLPNPDCVVKVGEGRGFIVVNRIEFPPEILRSMPRPRFRRPARFMDHRLIITASHCIAATIPCTAADLERMCKHLGTLDGSKKDIWGKILFVDPIADIAVLRCPDNYEMDERIDAYRELTESASFVRIGKATSGHGWVLSLEGRWVRTTLKVNRRIDGTALSTGPTEPGMSGSPILNRFGRAVGVVALGSQTVDAKGSRKDNALAWAQPILSRNLPGWLLEGRG